MRLFYVFYKGYQSNLFVLLNDIYCKLHLKITFFNLTFMGTIFVIFYIFEKKQSFVKPISQLHENYVIEFIPNDYTKFYMILLKNIFQRLNHCLAVDIKSITFAHSDGDFNCRK